MSKENFEVVTAFKNESLFLGFPKKYPKKLEKKLIKFFKKIKTVEKAYLLQMVQKETEISFLLVLQTSEFDSVAREVSNICSNTLSKDEVLNMVSFETELGKTVASDWSPFYIRKISQN